jgi:hypothetical protein
MVQVYLCKCVNIILIIPSIISNTIHLIAELKSNICQFDKSTSTMVS